MSNSFHKLPDVQLTLNKLIIVIAVLIASVSCRQSSSDKNNNTAHLSAIDEVIRLQDEKDKTINKWNNNPGPSPIVPDKDSIYDIVQKMPEFPQGFSSLYTYLKQEVDRNYPKKAKEENIQGRVIIQFVVEKDGSITNPRVIRSIHPLLDTVAVNIVRRMPRWYPGSQDKEYVRVKYTMPVMFRLADKTPKVHKDSETGEEYVRSIED